MHGYRYVYIYIYIIHIHTHTYIYIYTELLQSIFVAVATVGILTSEPTSVSLNTLQERTGRDGSVSPPPSSGAFGEGEGLRSRLYQQVACRDCSGCIGSL